MWWNSNSPCGSSRYAGIKHGLGISLAWVLSLAFLSIHEFVWDLACRTVQAGQRWCLLTCPMEHWALSVFLPFLQLLGETQCHQLGSAPWYLGVRTIFTCYFIGFFASTARNSTFLLKRKMPTAWKKIWSLNLNLSFGVFFCWSWFDCSRPRNWWRCISVVVWDSRAEMFAVENTEVLRMFTIRLLPLQAPGVGPVKNVLPDLNKWRDFVLGIFKERRETLFAKS